MFIQDKDFPWTMQQAQKILTTLALSAAKPGKERITNNGAIAILTLVPGPGVVCLQVVAMNLNSAVENRNVSEARGMQGPSRISPPTQWVSTQTHPDALDYKGFRKIYETQLLNLG